MAEIVLVHGAWSGAWCWYKLIPELQARGHGAHAVDLPGRGNSLMDITDVTVADFVNHLSDCIDRISGPVHLLGDNINAITVTETAERRPDKVAGIVYLTGVFGPPGEAHPPLDMDSMARQARRITHMGRVQMLLPEWEERLIYHDCPPELLEELHGRMVPEIADLSPPELDDPAHHWQQMPKSYILTLQNRAISQSLQRRLIKAHDLSPAIEMDTGACPYLVDPAGLAQHINTIVEQTPTRS